MNPFSTWEAFDSCVKVLTLVFATVGVVLTVCLWRKNFPEKWKRQFTILERACFVIGAVLLWVAFASDGKVTRRDAAVQIETKRTATNALAEAQGTASRLLKIDPRKRKIEQVSARVWFSTSETNAIEWPPNKDKLAFSPISLSWGIFREATNNLWKVRLEADDFRKLFLNGSQRYYLDFHMDYLVGGANLHGAIVEDADAWDAICFDPIFLPWNPEILDGEASISINNAAAKKFRIPPQRPYLPVVTARIHNGQVSGFGVGQGGMGGLPVKLE